MKLNAKQLRELEEKRAQGAVRQVNRNPIYFILENIYDTYNIGGLFRLADAIAVEKIYLCGEMEIPPNSRIKKASIGTYKIVDWTYKKSVKDAIDDLKSKKYISHSGKSRAKSRDASRIVVNNNDSGPNFAKATMGEQAGMTEQIPKQVRNDNITIQQYNNKSLKIIAVEQNSKAIIYSQAQYQLPLAFIFGNESYGVLAETLELVDQIVEIPMWGINRSLNVIVSAAIVSYWVMSKI